MVFRPVSVEADGTLREADGGWLSAGDLSWTKPKTTRQVKMQAYFTGERLVWLAPDYSTLPEWKRVPAEDKVIEVEE